MSENIQGTVVCPNFVKYKIRFFAGENYFCNNCEWIVSFEIFFSLRMLIYYFCRMPTASTKCANL